MKMLDQQNLIFGDELLSQAILLTRMNIHSAAEAIENTTGDINVSSSVVDMIPTNDLISLEEWAAVQSILRAEMMLLAQDYMTSHFISLLKLSQAEEATNRGPSDVNFICDFPQLPWSGVSEYGGEIQIEINGEVALIFTVHSLEVSDGSKRIVADILLTLVTIGSFVGVDDFVRNQIGKSEQTTVFTNQLSYSVCQTKSVVESMETEFISTKIEDLKSIDFPSSYSEASRSYYQPQKNVCVLQAHLKRYHQSMNYAQTPIKIDGIIGPETYKAFENYRKNMGYSATYTDSVKQMLEDENVRRGIIHSIFESFD